MYITGAIYHEVTGRDESEATQARIERACRLLDARIGNYPYRSDWKLDMDRLRPDQVSAVQEWVCGMIISFAVNNDGPQVAEGVRLGRFKKRPNLTPSATWGPSLFTAKLIIIPHTHS